MGSVLSVDPVNPLLTYNSIATGKYADKHGILGPQDIDASDDPIRTTSQSRRSKAFWNILDQNQKVVHMVNFPGTGPTEPTSGTFVAPGLPVPVKYEGPVSLPEDLLRTEHRDTLEDLIVTLEDIDPDTLKLFLPLLGQMSPKDQNIAHVGAAIAATMSIHAIATWLAEHTEWNVLSVNYPLIDAMNARYLPFQGPRLPWVEEGAFQTFQAAVAGAISLSDMLLGRLLELVGDDTSVLVYSPIGCLGRDQVAALPPAIQTDPMRWRRGKGMFVLRAPGCRTDELIHRVEEVDLCPTLLHLAGVSPGSDMDGRVLSEAFTDATPVAPSVESWEALPPEHPQPQTPPPIFRPDDVGLAASFPKWASRKVRLDNTWNLVQQYLHSPRRGLAMPWMLELCQTHPLTPDRLMMSARELYLNGCVDEALGLMGPLAKTSPDTPLGQFIGGLIALHDGELYQALDLFENACREDSSATPELYYHLGVVCLQIGKFPRAAEAYRKAIELNDRSLESYVGLSTALLRMEAFEDAAEAALEAVSLDFGRISGHFSLAQALLGLGRTDEAGNALRTALRLDPTHGPLRRFLEQLDAPMAAGLLDEFPATTSAQVPLGTPQTSPITLAAQRVAQWQSTYVEQLRAGIDALPGYLQTNAKATDQTFDPDAMAAFDPTDAGDWIIRPALPRDLPTINQMFNDAFSVPFHRELLMLHPEGSDQMLGGMTLQLYPQTLSVSLGLASHRGDDTRMPQVLTQLLRAGIVRAAAGGARQVNASVTSDSPASLREMYEAHGFREIRHQERYELDAAALRDRSLDILEMLRGHGEVPETTRIVRGDQVDRARFDEFLKAFFNDGSGPDPITPSLCLLVYDGQTPVAGYVGQKVSPDRIKVPRLAVSALHRLGWATPMLMGEGCQLFCDDGISIIEFYTDEEQYPGFIKIARKLGAAHLGSITSMALDVGTPWAP